jgi:hypothetical protein
MGVFIVYFQTDMAQGPEIPALSDKKILIRHTWKLGIGGQKGKGWLGLHLQNLLQGRLGEEESCCGLAKAAKLRHRQGILHGPEFDHDHFRVSRELIKSNLQINIH